MSLPWVTFLSVVLVIFMALRHLRSLKMISDLQAELLELYPKKHTLESNNCRMCGALVAVRFKLEHYLGQEGYRKSPVIPPEELQSMIDYCIVHTSMEDCRDRCDQICRICGQHICVCVRGGLVVGDHVMCKECEDRGREVLGLLVREWEEL